MKEIFFIDDTTENKITYYHLLIFLATLPFDRFYSELTLISLLIHTLIHLTKEKWAPIKLTTIVMPISVYLLTSLGTVYSHYREEAFFEWERQLAFLLFPFIFLLSPLDLKKYTLPLLKGFSVSCIFTILYLYGNALLVILYHDLPFSSLFGSAFINHNFSLPIDMHATYFSMYIGLSFITVLYWIIHSKKTPGRIWLVIGLGILLAGILQLSSRAVLIALFIIINIIVPFFLLKRDKRARFMAISLIVSVLVMITVTRSDAFRNRYIAGLKDDLTQAIINNNVLEPRAARWQCAWELIKVSPVWGHGSGSEIALLKEIYFERRFYNSYINELNAHNQYLSFLIKTGLIGLAVFLCLLYMGFRDAIRCRNVFFCSFLVLAAVVCFSENILDANKGIFFFAFFFSLFSLSEKKKFMKS